MNNRAKIIKLVILVLVIVVAGIVLFLLGDIHAVQNMTIKRITPTQAANAMKADNFYTNYRESSLLVQGTVSSVSNSHNDLVVSFNTSSTFQARCDFGSSAAIFHQGQTITILSEGGAAERQPSAVLLTNCILP
jgi:hypothetical protein